MLKYLIIPLSDDSTSFCNYNANRNSSKTISTDVLRDAIFWAMKENLSVQFVFPKEKLSDELLELTESIDNIRIVPSDIADSKLKAAAEIVVFNDWSEMDQFEFQPKQSYVIRTSFEELLANKSRLIKAILTSNRVNIVITDIDGCSDGYEDFLHSIVPTIIEEYKKGHQVQLNILTDRIMLREMNNCNAGYESLTLAPNGNYYICPGFWLDGNTPIGNLSQGIRQNNSQLFQLSYAPICRECDAWQCKRCVWLNKRLTREVNTPSHEQCVAAHIERKVSQYLLAEFRKIDPSYLPDSIIPEIDYLDPFDKIINKQ